MSKKGQKKPYKVEFQYDGQKRYRIAHDHKNEALREGREIARRGAAVQVFHLDPDTGARTDVVDYAHTPVPDDNRDLDLV